MQSIAILLFIAGPGAISIVVVLAEKHPLPTVMGAGRASISTRATQGTSVVPVDEPTKAR